MALNPHAEHIYEIASIWLNECLLNDGSLFWPNRKVWTSDNLDSFWSAFAENLDEGEGTFVDKWAQQLRDQSDDVHRMAVEVAAIYCLFPSSKQMGATSKRKLVKDVLAFSGDLGEIHPERWGLFERAVDGIGIGMTGAGYLAARPFHIGMYLGFAKTVKKSSASSIEDLDPTSILDEAFDLVSGTMNFQPISTKHILLHILWPESFEDYASAEYKKNMASNLSAHFGLTGLHDIDATILQARKYMEANGYEHNFSMYSDEVRLLWDFKPNKKLTGKASREIKETREEYTIDGGSISHVIAEKASVYEVAQLFRERVIGQKSSLLWPDQSIWVNEVVDQFLEDFAANSASKQRSWLELFEVQTKQSDPRTAMMLADAYAFLMQFAAIDDYKGSTKTTTLGSILNWIERKPDPASLRKVVSAFDIGVGSPGTAFTAALPHQLAYIPLFVSCLWTSTKTNISDVASRASRMANEVHGFQKTTVPARNIILHLLEPERFERIASRAHKMQIAEYFAANIEDLNINLEEDLDIQLRQVRKALAGNYFAMDFDFYDDAVKRYWYDGQAWPPDTTNCPLPPPPITELAAATHLDESRLREIETLLNDKQQLIFEGPPGSGKTFVAEKFARYFTGQPLTDSNPDPSADQPVSGNDQIEIVQFHQSYSYEDFVEGIRPRTNDAGQLIYDVEPGIFRVFADKAWANRDKKFVLIIDEINRGNVSRILGELMLLLEYRDKSATLPYSKQQLTIPPNLYIIGTMNSADRSLSQIDYALRRRFYFVRFMSVEDGTANVLRSWLDTNSDNAGANSRAVAMFVKLNTRLSQRLGTDDLQVGHSYFMRTDIHDAVAQEMVWKYAVMPLLREYLYHDRERDEVLKTFSLEAIQAELSPAAPEPEQPETVDEVEAES